MTGTNNEATVVPPRRRPGRRWAVAAVALVAAVAGFGWWGNPRLTEGSLIGPGEGMSWANDGVTDTRMLVRGVHPATVTATFSIRNDGRLPFTVHGLDVDEFPGWLAGQQVAFEPGFLESDGPANPQEQVTLAPEEEAAVRWSLTMTCNPQMADGYTAIEFLRFRVSWLGIATARDLPLDRPITFASDNRVPNLPPC